MKVLVTASERFAITKDGHLWSAKATLDYYQWAGYLEVYDEVYLMGRAKLHPNPPLGWVKTTGPGVKAVPVPYFVGPWEYIKNYRGVKSVAEKAVAEAEAFQLRIPCTIGAAVYDCLTPQRPFGIEVIADPYDSFAPGSVKHPLRPFFRWWFPRQLRRKCSDATAALYVTKEALQRRYPCRHYSVGVSDAELPQEMLVSTSRPVNPGLRKFTLIQVGTLAQLYKAPDVLIAAIAVCVQNGLDLKLVLIGDGKYRTQLEQQAKNLGISERVHFCGQLSSRDAVRDQLDQADLFVLPSHQEGLPKAMVEAMGRALPVIGSTVGGIPELLPPEDMVSPGDVAALANKIREVVNDPQRMAQMSARNLEKAKEYTKAVLRGQRLAFYRYVREKTEVWLKQQR
ncbi:glycosyltransferase family 4 protein [Komarekiella sp. 'clone 1']|uniref:Glycosyltransferase family 4 protein n=1 Tax=Komarekiella delphini-convector SJRDD-AB1 TaxID=2593771 RepID=A0AA40VSQ6_9NOST|nr:glycosyltransferase family 4 protein [Komarekiella delphini-convector]MBD6618272.1 glycosyltransferase family 4 protein [Komarekiella delphini-convector SJRDD-AB1]